MRLIRRLAALVASTVMVVAGLVAPTPAEAVTRAQKVTLSVDRTWLVAGQKVALTGKATPAGRRTIHLQQRQLGSATWRTVKKVTTTSSGRFSTSLTLTSTRSSYFRAYLPKRAGYKSASSKSTAKVSVSARSVLAITSVQPDVVTAGLAATVSGTAKPAAGSVVQLQGRTGPAGAWATLARATVSAAGRYQLAFVPAAPGTLELRVYRPASPGRAAGYSASVRVPVRPTPAADRSPRQRQAVSLGIESIVNPQDWADLRAKVDAAHVNVLHLSAGRVEWTAFDWKAHPEVAAEPGLDHLARAIDELGTMPDGSRRGIDLMIDALVPEWIKKDPAIAGRDAVGGRATYMASASALHDGAVGDRLVELARELAVRYQPMQISFTELAFDEETFGADDLALYRRMTGEKDWPRAAAGGIDERSAKIGAWRSQVITDLLVRVRKALDEVTPQVGHRVQLGQDVLVNWENPELGRPDAGHDYQRLWPVVDRVVAWVYFDGGERQVSDITALASALAAMAPPDSLTLSVGLWGGEDTADDSQQAVIPATLMADALNAARSAKLESVNVTPVWLMTPEHWRSLGQAWPQRPPVIR